MYYMKINHFFFSLHSGPSRRLCAAMDEEFNEFFIEWDEDLGLKALFAMPSTTPPPPPSTAVPPTTVTPPMPRTTEEGVALAHLREERDSSWMAPVIG